MSKEMEHEITVVGDFHRLDTAIEGWKDRMLGRVRIFGIKHNSYNPNHTAVIKYEMIPEMRFPIGFGNVGGELFEKVYKDNPTYLTWYLKNVYKISLDKRIRLKEITGEKLDKLEQNFKDKYPDRV